MSRRPSHHRTPTLTDLRRRALTDQVVAFLTDRLRDDLARILDRPGSAAAMLAVVDEHLAVLAAGRLPRREDLRLLLYGYGGHRDYDPDWADLLSA